ncbi:MAG: hypothetical protein Kow0092_32980 [Deferrisomatales bacterium]
MRRGFTLIEVLVTLTLLALVITLVQGAYSGAARSRRLAASATERAHLSAVVLQRLADELSMARFSPDRKDVTGLTVDADADGNAVLWVTTRVPAIHGFSQGGAAQVSYALEEGEAGWVLVRRQSAKLDADLDTEADPYPLLRGVSGFRVLCYDGEQWLESWDSAERAEEPFLPLAVSVEVAWPTEAAAEEGDGPAERVYRTAAPVYGAR